MPRPKICLLFAGGTIGMVKNPKTGALEPASSAVEIIRDFPEIQKHMQLDFKMVVNIDSSNMSPQNWQDIAAAIKKNYEDYDGFVVCHGTDTMAYTASALSFALQNLSKPVVFTGSLIPLKELGSDGRNNLIYACITATLDIAEVCIVMHNKIHRGNRARKYHESFLASFHSPNFPALGELGRPPILHEWRKKRRKRTLTFLNHFEPNIALLTLFPGFDPVIIDRVIERGAKGMVIQGFGPGNVPFLETSIIPQIEEATDAKIPVVITNQMENGATNLENYQAGLVAKKAGAISSHDMTLEATVTKLMWTLARSAKTPKPQYMKRIRDLMEKDIAGELEA